MEVTYFPLLIRIIHQASLISQLGQSTKLNQQKLQFNTNSSAAWYTDSHSKLVDRNLSQDHYDYFLNDACKLTMILTVHFSIQRTMGSAVWSPVIFSKIFNCHKLEAKLCFWSRFYYTTAKSFESCSYESCTFPSH